ncbi:helical backbone metal receptor [bacterium]|nr:helical backbone metal receptor [bacterium]
MRRIWVLCFLILLLAGAAGIRYYRPGRVSPPDGAEGEGLRSCSRIISLSPGITETLFALGLGDKVVGVTRFCNYPPEARKKPRIGGYIDPNYEAIAALRPDIVFLLTVHEEAVNYLRDMGIHYVTVRNEKTADILDAIMTIGKTCGMEDKAREIVSDINGRIGVIKKKTDGLQRPRVLISVGRTVGSGSLSEVFVAGHNTFYDELITYAGGINAYEGHDVAYPSLSGEGILMLDPDIIVDLLPGFGTMDINEAAAIKDWEGVPGLEAVKNHRISVIDSDYTVIPGPRFIMLLEDLARIIHKEAPWETR